MQQSFWPCRSCVQLDGSCQLIPCETLSSCEHAIQPFCLVVPNHQPMQLCGHASVLLLTARQRLQVLCTALHCLHCIALHCTALHCTALHCTALHCTALHCAAQDLLHGQVNLCRRTGSGPTRQWSSGWLPTGKNVRHACRRRCSARYTLSHASQYRLHCWLCLHHLHALLTLLVAGRCGGGWSNVMLHSKAWTQVVQSLTLLWSLLRGLACCTGLGQGIPLPAKHISLTVFSQSDSLTCILTH